MELSKVKDITLEFFSAFETDLLVDNKNDPFVMVTLFNLSPYNPHGDSFFLYQFKNGMPAEHTELTTTNFATALTLEALYVSQKPSKSRPIEEKVGVSRGFVINKTQFLIVTVITNLDDAKFVSLSLINKLKIALNIK